MASIMQILRRIGGAKATPTSGSAGQIALWKAGTATTDAASLYVHDGVQWNEMLDTSAQWTANGANINRAAGNVGIGATTPVAKLQINKTASDTLLYVVDPASPANALFVVSNAGHVGIGNNGNNNLLAVGPPDDNFCVDVNGYKVTATLGQPLAAAGGRAAFAYDRSTGACTFSIGTNTLRHDYLVAAGTGQMISSTTYGFTGAGSALNIDSSGGIFRASSSIKYKKDVEPLEASLTDKAIRELQPVWYRTKNPAGDDKAEWSHIGLIAEDVDKVEKRLVKYRTVEVVDGATRTLDKPEPEDVDYARLSVLLLDYVQRLEKRVAVLEARP